MDTPRATAHAHVIRTAFRAIVWLAFGASAAAAQSTPVTGRITAQGVALPNVDVLIRSMDRDSLAATKTNADGHYEVVIADAPSVLLMSFVHSEYTTQFRQIPAVRGVAVTVATIDLIARATSAQTLAAMKVVAPRAKPERVAAGLMADPPGAQRIIADVGSTSAIDLTGDVTGDPLVALTAVPGITVIPGLEGGLQVSVAGLGSDQNTVTLNGSPHKGTLPREAAIQRVATASYNPATRGGGASSELAALGNVFGPIRSFRLTFDPAALQTAPPGATPLGARTSTPTFSGKIAGNLPWHRAPAVVTFQASRRASSLSTLADLDTDAFGQLRLDADSVRRLLQVLPSIHLPSVLPGAPGSAVSTALSTLARVDFTTAGASESVPPGAGGKRGIWESWSSSRIAYLLAGGSVNQTEGTGVSPSTTPLVATNARTSSWILRGFHSSFAGAFLNETSIALNGFSSSRQPFVNLPAAVVEVPNGSGTLAITSLGGGSGAVSNSSTISAAVSNSTTWTTTDNTKDVNFFVESIADHVASRRGSDLGSYRFSSIADLAASVPASFTRNPGMQRVDITGQHHALGLGLLMRPSPHMSSQAGLRIERHTFSELAAYGSETILKVFSATSTPRVTALSPMAGFTWQTGKVNAHGWADGRHVLWGGIRDYRGVLSTDLVAGVAGNGDGGSRFTCIGNAAPRPDWARFLADTSAVPAQCDIGSQPVFSQTGPRLAAYDDGFTVGHSWRADLGWKVPLFDLPGTSRYGRHVSGTIQAMLALNSQQSETVDRNFSGVARSALPEEANRPLFVNSQSVVANSGVISPVDSRIDTQAGFVNVREATGRSRAMALTLGVQSPSFYAKTSSRVGWQFSSAYTLSDIRAQTNGFASTAGDPRTHTDAPGLFNRHTVQLSTTLSVPDWALFSAAWQLRSGTPFTPVVAGDINGDGFSNDRAFVFNPSQTADTAVRRSMEALLRSAPSTAASCLTNQLGTIAKANSCWGPWSSSLNASVELDAFRLRMPNRGRVSLRFINVLALADRALHGESGLHGWGQPAIADQVLLTARGFDPVKQRFNYVVNPRFGDTWLGRVFSSPFRVVLDVNLQLGPGLERAVLEGQIERDSIRYGVRDSAELHGRLRREPANLFHNITGVSSQLGLTHAQVVTIDSLTIVHEARREAAYSVLAQWMATAGRTASMDVIHAHWRQARDAVMTSAGQAGLALRRVITTEQLQKARELNTTSVLNNAASAEDDRELQRYLALWHRPPLP